MPSFMSIMKSTFSSFIVPVARLSQWNAASSPSEPSSPGPQTPEVASPTLPSPTIANWTIIRQLGRGGFGGVYLAKNDTTGALQAVKVVPKEYPTSAATLGCIFSERLALTLLSTSGQDYFLDLHSAFHDTQNFYFVTNFAAGGCLWRRLTQDGPLSNDTVRFYMAEIVYALAALHSKDILHRDIKPENIFLDERGHIVLGDFGLAKIFSNDDPRTHFATDVCGTPEYAAPEVWKGAGYSYPADAWSLGVLFYFLLFGELPFGNINATLRAMKIMNGEPVEDAKGTPRVIDDATREVLAGLLNGDEFDRYTLEEIMDSEYLQDIDWELIATKSYQAPWVPPVIDNTVSTCASVPFRVGRPYTPHTDPFPAFTSNLGTIKDIYHQQQARPPTGSSSNDFSLHHHSLPFPSIPRNVESSPVSPHQHDIPIILVSDDIEMQETSPQIPRPDFLQPLIDIEIVAIGHTLIIEDAGIVKPEDFSICTQSTSLYRDPGQLLAPSRPFVLLPNSSSISTQYSPTPTFVNLR